MTNTKDRELLEAEMALEAAYAEQEAKEKNKPLNGRLFNDTNECVDEKDYFLVGDRGIQVKDEDERRKHLKKLVEGIQSNTKEAKYFKPKEQTWKW